VRHFRSSRHFFEFFLAAVEALCFVPAGRRTLGEAPWVVKVFFSSFFLAVFGETVFSSTGSEH
jgi:hypothetical protein